MQKILKMQQKLLKWYHKNGRLTLPWRNLSALPEVQRAYRVYISEIMLQQTQVKTVLEQYYFPFLQKFPTLQVLASSEESVILQSWSGLGYYARARNMYKTALECVESYGGILPKDTETLQKLSGIGHYTAGAISCFGYGRVCAFFDSNMKRVLIRLFALRKEADFLEILATAKQFLNTQDAFNHNQALMDLGAIVCTAKKPNCLFCPLNQECLGKSRLELYTQSKKMLYKRATFYASVLVCGEYVALVKSTQKLYKNLWIFPLLENPLKNSQIIGRFKHGYTHYRLELSLSVLELENLDSLEHFKALGALVWFKKERVYPNATIPLASITKKALELLQKY